LDRTSNSPDRHSFSLIDRCLDHPSDPPTTPQSA